MFVVILGVTILTFGLMHFAPGDAAEMIAQSRYGADLSQEQVDGIRIREGLDAPIYIQYVRWLSPLLRGDLGRSLVNERPVLAEILRRFPATLQLTLAGMAVSLLIALPIGLLSAVKQNSAVDYAGITLALLGVSMPNFWLALILILIFSLHAAWFPVFGMGGVRHLVLPALTLGTGLAAISTRLIRSSMLEVLGQDYVLAARARGVAEQLVIGKHAFRNAMIPVVTVIGLQFAHLLEGAVIVETIFAWPGMGKLLVDSIFARDFPMIQGCALLFAGFVTLINLLVDLSYPCLDPRIRYARSRP